MSSCSKTVSVHVVGGSKREELEKAKESNGKHIHYECRLFGCGARWTALKRGRQERLLGA